MSSSSTTVLFFALFCASVSAMYGPSSSVVSLTDKTFKSQVMKSDSVWLVEFYAPWCGHCKSLAPEWEKAAKALKGVVNIGAVDATQYEKLGSKYGVRGFPTIKVFGAKKRSPTDYQGARTASAIVQAGMKVAQQMVQKRIGGKVGGGSNKRKKSGSSPVIELTEDNFNEQVLESNDLWLVEFFAPWCGHCKALAPEWEQAARKLKGDVKLGAVDATVHGSLAQRFGVKGYPTIKVFGYGPKAGDSSAEDYQGPRKAGGIIDYAMAKLDAADVEVEVPELLSAAVFEEKCAGKTICVVAVLPHIMDGGKVERNRYIELTKEFATKNRKHPFEFLWSAGGSQPKLEQTLGLNFGFPALVAVNQGKLRFAVHKGAFSTKRVNSFLGGIMTGRTRTQPLDAIPQLETVAPWDGEDAPAAVEEEFSLDDIMGDDD